MIIDNYKILKYYYNIEKEEVYDVNFEKREKC